MNAHRCASDCVDGVDSHLGNSNRRSQEHSIRCRQFLWNVYDNRRSILASECPLRVGVSAAHIRRSYSDDFHRSNNVDDTKREYEVECA